MFSSNANDIIIIDNILPQDISDKIEETVTSNLFPWYILRDIQKEKLYDDNEYKVSSNKKTLNTIQLSHGVFDFQNKNSQVNSELFDLTKKITDICCDKFYISPKYLRMKYNLLMNHSKNKKGIHNTPHVDNPFIDNYSMIYYVNDSDGDTFIFNQTYQFDNPQKIKKFSVFKKIEPRKNRAILFPGRYFHASSNPIRNEHRIVLNVNLFKI